MTVLEHLSKYGCTSTTASIWAQLSSPTLAEAAAVTKAAAAAAVAVVDGLKQRIMAGLLEQRREGNNGKSKPRWFQLQDEKEVNG